MGGLLYRILFYLTEPIDKMAYLRYRFLDSLVNQKESFDEKYNAFLRFCCFCGMFLE